MKLSAKDVRKATVFGDILAGLGNREIERLRKVPSSTISVWKRELQKGVSPLARLVLDGGFEKAVSGIVERETAQENARSAQDARILSASEQVAPLSTVDDIRFAFLQAVARSFLATMRMLEGQANMLADPDFVREMPADEVTNRARMVSEQVTRILDSTRSLTSPTNNPK